MPSDFIKTTKEHGRTCQEMADVIYSELAHLGEADRLTIITQLAVKVLKSRPQPTNYRHSCELMFTLIMMQAP